MWLVLKNNQKLLFHTDNISQSCHMLAELHCTLCTVYSTNGSNSLVAFCHLLHGRQQVGSQGQEQFRLGG